MNKNFLLPHLRQFELLKSSDELVEVEFIDKMFYRNECSFLGEQ
jgi:hypothetical protein